ncbi:MAG: flagellar basal body rod protein FlgB [Proteobacteria bacterium]|nr:flagellar basal body rod protein FlgB [Pseudomonadota bacterium]
MQVGFLNFYGAVLDLAQQRETLIANNIANADTPGFKAQDVPFDRALSAQLTDGPDNSLLAGAAPQYRATGTVTLDGNDVSLDKERLEAAQNSERMIGASTFLHQATSALVMALRPNPGGI